MERDEVIKMINKTNTVDQFILDHVKQIRALIAMPGKENLFKADDLLRSIQIEIEIKYRPKYNDMAGAFLDYFDEEE